MLGTVWSQEKAAELGAVLRRRRMERGLSQESLAYQAGITKNQLQLIESARSTGRKDSPGPSNPRMATLVGLADVLQVSLADLMGDAGL